MASEPVCPMGHEMELYQVSSGSWRYGCRVCATSYKQDKRQAYGWISPMKSTKERARQAAIKRPARAPLTAEEIASTAYVWPCWLEVNGERPKPVILDRDSVGYFVRGKNKCERYSIETYGDKWQCWIGKYPSDEERRNAKMGIGISGLKGPLCECPECGGAVIWNVGKDTNTCTECEWTDAWSEEGCDDERRADPGRGESN